MTTAPRIPVPASLRIPRPPRPPYVPLEGFVLVIEADHVTDEVLEVVRTYTDGWYNDSPIDWEDIWERMDGADLRTGRIDLGPEQDTPAMRKVQRIIRAERKAG